VVGPPLALFEVVIDSIVGSFAALRGEILLVSDWICDLHYPKTKCDYILIYNMIIPSTSPIALPSSSQNNDTIMIEPTHPCQEIDTATTTSQCPPTRHSWTWKFILFSQNNSSVIFIILCTTPQFPILRPRHIRHTLSPGVDRTE